MTDLPPRSPLPEPPGDEDDLLASLYLDGEATPEERARVEADPAMMALVEQFRTIAAQTANVSAPPGLAEMQIAAALDVFDGAMADTVNDAAVERSQPARVSSLADRRARRSGLPAWIGAAAVSALVLGGLGFVATRDSGRDDEAASTATSLSPSGADRAGASDSAPAMEMEATTESADLEQSTAATDDVAAEAMMDEEAADSPDDDSADEGLEDDGSNDDGDGQPLGPDEAAAYYVANGPVDLEAFAASTAEGYFEQLLELPLQPIDASPCANSPVVSGLVGIDSFIPVIFDQQPASLVVSAGSPATARIVDSTCEIALS